MQAKPKSNSVITHTLNADGTLTFNVLGAGSFTTDPRTYSAAVQQRAAIHGMIQRISDKAAISRDTETGLAATPETKLAAMKELVAFYETGTDQWSMKRSAAPARELTPEEKKALMAKWAAEMGMEITL